MKEKHYVYRGLGFGLALFLVGVAFCYFALMPSRPRRVAEILAMARLLRLSMEGR